MVSGEGVTPSTFGAVRTSRLRTVVSVVLVTAGLVAVAGCGSSKSPSSDSGSASPVSSAPSVSSVQTTGDADPDSTDGDEEEVDDPVPPAPAGPEQQGSVTWKRCESKPALQCSQVEVPLDYTKPTGEKITIAISRRPHTTASSRGVVLTNPGGPGLPGLDMPSLAANLPRQVADNFDWIGIDTRGIGSSKPALTCNPTYDSAPIPAPNPIDAAAEQAWIARVKGYAEACAKSPDTMKLLPFMSTADIAADFDQVRVALGVDKVVFYGASFGTYIGQVYAATFPQHVDKMVLDSAFEAGRSWTQLNESQDIAATKAFNEFTVWVSKNDSDLKLGTDPAAIRTRYLAKLDELTAKPPAEAPGAAYQWNRLAIQAAYSQSNWPAVGGSLNEVLNKNNLAVLAGEPSESDNATAGYLAVGCLETKWPAIDEVITNAKKLAVDHPEMTWDNSLMNGPCSFWPVAAKPPAPVDLSKVTAPVLIVGETYDTATVFSGMLATRARLPTSRLIEGVGGTSHATVLGSSGCVADTVADFLDTGALPERKPDEVADKQCPPYSLPTTAP